MAIFEESKAPEVPESEATEKEASWPYRVVSLPWQRRLRVWHRRLAVVTAIQLLLWTVSGIYFAFVDITMVRGEPHRLAPETQSIDLAAFDFPVTSTSEIVIKPRLKGELVVGVTDPESGLTEWLSPTGQPVTPLTAEQAISAVSSKTDIAVDVAEWVTTAAEAAEYRGRQLPLWRAYSAESPSLRVYVDPRSGDIVAIRNLAWRAWDFLWMLHIMDYDDRDDIGTWLLKLFSVMALLTAIAGIALYVMIPWRRASKD